MNRLVPDNTRVVKPIKVQNTMQEEKRKRFLENKEFAMKHLVPMSKIKQLAKKSRLRKLKESLNNK
jgi:hypothetical protein